MSRRISRTSNLILDVKPNQFAKARFRNIRWNRACKEYSSNDNTDNDSETSTESNSDLSAEELTYLENRFKGDGCSLSARIKN